MGTEIRLDIARMCVTYAKNNMGEDHGPLFQEKDRNSVRSDQIDYDYFKNEGEDPTEMEMAFTRKLKDVLPRLDLMGYTQKEARLSYEIAVAMELDRDDPPQNLMGYEEFCAFVAKHPVETLDNDFNSGDDEKIKGRFANDPDVERIPSGLYGDVGYSERSYFGNLIGIIHPYGLLHVLAGNPQNAETDIVWQYGPLATGGYVDASAFVPCARRHGTFLIATEGSSDVHILHRALEILRPDVADFFRFIDVSESHPFSGTGSLVKFAEGLTKIDVHNQVVFVFDNDAEGADACRKVRSFALPANMRAILLPDLDVFKSFPARGPNGVENADINGRAAAIECYLDLDFIKGAPSQVTWTNFKKELGVYQGALDNKEAHYKAFLKKAGSSIADGSYDVSKLQAVLNALIAECTSIAQGRIEDEEE